MIKTHTRSRIISTNQLKQNNMTPFNINTDNVVEYLESLNEETINSLLDDLFSCDDLEERMDICTQILTEVEMMLEEGESESDWFYDLENELKDITLS